MPTTSVPEPESGATAWLDDADQRWFDGLEVPADLVTSTDEALVGVDEAWEAELATLSPADRFEREHGVPAPAEQAGSTERTALLAQDAAVQVARVHAIVEAHRISALLTAYERSIEDLAVRFGRAIGSRGGLGAQAFFKSMGLQLQVHPMRLAHEVDTAATLRDRLPRTWAVFLQGASSWSRADVAATAADGLDDEHLAAFDARAARAITTSTRLKGDLRKTRERLQADSAATRARRTHERRTTTLELGHDGEASLVLSGSAVDWVPRNDALHRAAVAAHGVAGETRGIAQLRHDIALDILDEGLRRYEGLRWYEGLRRYADQPGRVPDRKPVAVTLVITVPALAWLGRSTEQAVLGGYEPISMEAAKALAGSATSFIRVLTDPVTGVRLTMDQKVYSPPVDLARWVRIRDGRSRFPGSTRPAHLCDIDHAREWQHGGPTNDTNLVTLDRPTHIAKSAGLLQEQLLDSGIVGWTDAWGHWFEDPPEDPLDPVPPELLPPPTSDAGSDDPCPF